MKSSTSNNYKSDQESRNLEVTRHHNEQKKAPVDYITTTSNASDVINSDYSDRNTSRFKDSGLSNNIRFEKTEGLFDKAHKYINETFRRDYNGQKKKSKRNLK